MTIAFVLATILLAFALALGTLLALRRHGGLPALPLAGAHGFAAIAGLALLVYVLPGSHRGEAAGARSFGIVAAAFLSGAALVGFVMLAVHIRVGRRAGALVGIHATLAVSGFVIFLAYAMLG